MRLAGFSFLLLLGCAASETQMNARADRENIASRDEALRAFFARGLRPLSPPPVTRTLTLPGVNSSCDSAKEHPATVSVRVGDAAATTTFDAACALATGRQKELRVRFENDAADTLLTSIPRGSAFAVTASGKVTRYSLVPQVKEERRGFQKGVSCCCDTPPPPPTDASLEVVVGPYPATGEEVITYDIVTVIFCDPSAPQ